MLADLQHNAPPMSAALAAGVVREELGRSPEDVFAEWDPVPIAAASIGQVHRAITLDGRAVAVKVQYPGVAEAVAADLDNAGLIFAGLGQLFPGLDHKSLVAELRERLVEELDYTQRGHATSRSSPATTRATPRSTCPRSCPPSRPAGCSPPSCPTVSGGTSC